MPPDGGDVPLELEPPAAIAMVAQTAAAAAKAASRLRKAIDRARLLAGELTIVTDGEAALGFVIENGR